MQMRLARVLLDLTQEQAGLQWGWRVGRFPSTEREYADLSGDAAADSGAT